MAKRLDEHLAAKGVEAKASDLIELTKCPDFTRHLQAELESDGGRNLRKVFLEVVKKMEKLPEEETQGCFVKGLKVLRECFEVYPGNKINYLMQNRPNCWGSNCVSGYFDGQCATEDEKIIEICRQLFEPGYSSLGRRSSQEGKKGKTEPAILGHFVRSSARIAKWPKK